MLNPLRFCLFLPDRYIALVVLYLMAGLGLAQAQYPTTSRLLSDVKAQSPNEFVTITPVGGWQMIHDKIPEWQPMNACSHTVDITGKKNADGTFWTYTGIAIYAKVGSGFQFDRLFLNEDATTLNGLNLPDNTYFLELFKQKLEAKDAMVMAMNYELKNATAFYGLEINKKPKVSGRGNELYVLYTVEVTLDLPNGQQLEKKVVPIEVKANKRGNEYVFERAMKKNDGTLVSMKALGSSDAVDKLEKYGFSDRRLSEMMQTNQAYAQAEGSNGEGYPVDRELIERIESAFLTREDNFAILFGPRGASMITDVEFKVKEGSQATTSANALSKVFIVAYIFLNENVNESTLKRITGQRELQVDFVRENGQWFVDRTNYLTEAAYIKNESIAWAYRNNYKDQTFEKRVFKK
jgi:hypothetical protein